MNKNEGDKEAKEEEEEFEDGGKKKEGRNEW